MQRNRGGWLGWVFFLFLIFGAQLVPPIARALSQLTGQPISSGMVFGGFVVLYVILMIAQSVIGGLGRMNQGGDTRLPTNTTVPPRPMQPPPQRRQPTTISTPPSPEQIRAQTTARRSSGTPGAPSIRTPNSALPPSGPPRFEPIIDPRILAFGIIGVVFFGLFLVVAIFLSGAI
ncbi:MAG: hypothetical protein HC822_01395 [Oscillochloris sp.]|nr:hypothetical protein [Oscillochloris sp.]